MRGKLAVILLVAFASFSCSGGSGITGRVTSEGKGVAGVVATDPFGNVYRAKPKATK